MAYHNQQPYDNYYSQQSSQQPYQDHYGYGQPTQQPAYDDPYAYSQSHLPYSTPQDNHYPPAPPADPYGHYDQGRSGGGYASSQSVNEKGGSYPNLGRADSEQTVAKGDYDPKRKEAVFANAGANSGARQSRGDIAAQMAAEGAIPEKAGLRMWRSDEHAGAFTRGGKGRTCGRCCCCAVIMAILLIICIVSAFLLWVRPPNITFNGIEAPTGGSEVNLIASGFTIDFRLNIGVTNPNFFGASFDSITATAFYPSNKTAPLGGGTMNDVKIKSHSNTTIHFPFQVNYTTTLDPNRQILTDLATKCGFLGTTASQIEVDYTLTLALKVLAIKIKPSFSSSAKFSCPLSESDIASALGSSTSSLQSILGSIAGASGSSSGGGNRRSLDAPDDGDRALEQRAVQFSRGGYAELVRRLARR